MPTDDAPEEPRADITPPVAGELGGREVLVQMLALFTELSREISDIADKTAVLADKMSGHESESKTSHENLIRAASKDRWLTFFLLAGLLAFGGIRILGPDAPPVVPIDMSVLPSVPSP